MGAGRERSLLKFSSRRCWPCGLLGMIALIFGVERTIARNAGKFTTHHASAWERSGAAAPIAAKCEVVAFGDSLVKHAVIPGVLEERSGFKAYNLAIPKGVFPAHTALLEQILRAGARPSAVLVDGEMLGEDPLATLRVWSELATPAESASLALEAKAPDFLARALLARLLPSCKAREEVRSSIVKALEGTSPEEPTSLPVFLRNGKRNAGAHVLPSADLSQGDPRPAELEKSRYEPSVWVCHPVNAVYVHRFLSLALSRGIRVVWLLPPYHPDVQSRRQRFGWYEMYVKYLRGLQEAYPNLTVVDGRKAGYPAEVIADMTHLSRVGAIAYSHALGGLLGDIVATGPRWVELPRYDAREAGALAAASVVEDIPESGRALNRVMAEVRRKREEKLVRVGAAGSGEGRRR